MFSLRLVLIALAAFTGLSSAATFEEDFATDPGARGWRVFGQTNLFSWDATQQNLRVTWDSSQPNSYYYHPLGTILSRTDDFTLEFNLRLSDIAPLAKVGPFEIAVSLLNFSNALRPDLWRGSGVDPTHGPRDLVEFDYFPAGYLTNWGNVDPSPSPTIVSSDNQFASVFPLLELTNGVNYHVRLSYNSAAQALHTTIDCEGFVFPSIDDVLLDTNFTDFRVDTIAISSYSDQGDIYDSVLAHGIIDQLVVTTPPLPLEQVLGVWTNGTWQVQFASQTNWTYVLERSSDLAAWSSVSPPAAGTGAVLVLEDPAPPGGSAFYRVRAQKP